MSPAFDAAMQTTVPTVRIAARADGSLQPSITKITDTPSTVTSVIADVGLEETPISPTIRDDTTTKHTPKIATPIAATSRGPNDMFPAKRFGTKARVKMTASGTTTTTHGGTSRSRSSPCDSATSRPGDLNPFTTAENELHIVGSARITATM